MDAKHYICGVLGLLVNSYAMNVIPSFNSGSLYCLGCVLVIFRGGVVLRVDAPHSTFLGGIGSRCWLREQYTFGVLSRSSSLCSLSLLL